MRSPVLCVQLCVYTLPSHVRDVRVYQWSCVRARENAVGTRRTPLGKERKKIPIGILSKYEV